MVGFIVIFMLFRFVGGFLVDKVSLFCILMVVFVGFILLGIILLFLLMIGFYMFGLLMVVVCLGIGNGIVFKLVFFYFLK